MDDRVGPGDIPRGATSGDPSSVVAVFAARGWLAEHDAVFRTLLCSHGIMVGVAAGECVYRQGDDAHGLYGILSGAIGIEGGHPRQTPLLGHILHAGDWFGLKAVVKAGARELTYRATEPARLLFIPNQRLLPLMTDDAGVAIRVGQLGEFGSRLSTWIVRDLLTPDAGRRLASVLLRVLGAGTVSPADPAGFWLTHRQLGEMSNLSRHHVGRKLADFERAGWIGCGYGRIRLLDVTGLAAFAYADEDR